MSNSCAEPGKVDEAELPEASVRMKEIRVHYMSNSSVKGTWSNIFREAGFQIVETDQDPDIVIFGHSASNTTIRRIVSAKRRFGGKPLLCLRHSEPYVIDSVYKYLDYTLPYDCNNNKRSLEKALNHRFDVFPKTKFCNFVYSNSFFPGTEVRINFCKKLMKHRHVDCAGGVLNNMPSAPDRFLPRGLRGRRNKLDFIAHHKFTIAFENSSRSHYISEKIFHPLSVGSIPIYWGCPEIAQYLNPASFINCHDFPSFDDVIDEVLKIESDQRLYKSYLEAPPIVSDVQFRRAGEERANIMRDMTESALLRRSHYKENRLEFLFQLYRAASWSWLRGSLDKLRIKAFSLASAVRRRLR